MDLRERILTAAARVYAETGFRGATTRRIAQEAGVNEVTIFRQFGSKAALLHEAIGTAAQAMHPPLPAVPVEPREELLEWSHAHIAELRDHRALIRTCMGEVEEHPELMPPQGSAPACAAHALADYFRRLQASGWMAADVSPATAAAMLMGALFSDAMGRDIMPDMFDTDPDDAVEAYVDLLLRAVSATRSAATDA